jgi:glycosyltransferase involved in cell wall biosynthesis
MKIGLFNYSDNLGGAARATFRIHKSLLNEGYNSTLYVNKKNTKDNSIKTSPYMIDKNFYNIRTNLISKFVKVTNPRIKSYNSPSILPSSWPKFINNSDIDLVHLNWINAEMMSIEDIAKIKKPMIWTFHDMWPFLGSQHLSNNDKYINVKNFESKNFLDKIFNLNEWTYFRKKKNWINPMQIVTPSQWLADCVKQSELMNSWPVETVPHPIDIDFWKPDSEENSRELLGINSDKIILVYGADGGVESFNKGFDLLLKSLEKLEDHHKDLVLCIFGNETDTKLKLNYPVINFGKITEDKKLRQIYRAADLCVVPSRQESFCQVALEAQSCGTPVIAFSVGGLKDIIEHNITGYLIKPFDVEFFSMSIKNFINNKKKNFIIKDNARKRVERLFSMPSVAKKYINIYKKILKI